MNNFLLVIAVAIVVETIMEYVKKAFPALKEKTGLIFILTAILGIGAAIAFDADIFASFGFASTIPYVGHVLTGILCGGGSNIVYDVIHRIQGGSDEAVG